MAGKESTADFASLKEKVLGKSGKEYWRSIEEYVDAPEFEEFVKREYPAHAEEWDSSLNRRNFLKVMGASLAFAGLTGCVIQPTEKIIPYVNQPEDLIPGMPMFFATSMTLGSSSLGILAKSNEGRPTKIEGNPEHPGSLGATDVLTQASLLNLYDPDRSQEIRFRGTSKTWLEFVTQVRGLIEEVGPAGGEGVRFLTGTVISPTLIDQFRRLLAEMPNAKWYQYEPVNKDNVFGGTKLAFGTPLNVVYKLDEADCVLSIDEDIFSGFNVRYMKDFAKKRKYHSEEKNNISRLYAIESTAGLTGAKADHRLAVKPSEVFEIVKAIAVAVGVAGVTSSYKGNEKWIAEMAKDLVENKGRSLVMVGDNHGAETQALVHAINEALEASGRTVVYTDPSVYGADTAQTEQLRELVKEIDGGQVKALVILGGNPVYNTPADLKLDKKRLEKVQFRIHLGEHYDETAELCQWHVHAKHYLEGWSDTRAFDGTAAIAQPLIAPLYQGKSMHEVVQLFFKENFEKKDLDIVQDFWKTQSFEVEGASSFEDKWRRSVHDGFIQGTALPAKTPAVNKDFIGRLGNPTVKQGELEFSILPDPSVYDGRFANNGWLQEVPKPLTKTTWENVAYVSPKTAERLGFNQAGRDAKELAGGAQGTSFINTTGGNLLSDAVKIKVNGLEIGKDVPIWIQPGQPDDVVTLFMGYGRTRAGRVGTGIGYSVFDARTTSNPYFGTIEEIKTTGATMTVASTQTHFSIQGREKQILQVFDFDAFNEDPTLGKQNDYYSYSMYPTEEYQKLYSENHKWGMAIDLNSCVGCNACVIACQSENNIPVVGKEQIEKSREMHWMRIDAYYSGSTENPSGPNFQPMLCQQCELAPCEPVCPVHATVHSAEGLNDMVYNRCVGTRYCSNNCPYKVRRFNFMLYQDWDTPQYKLMRNPEVTVRSRGVMEKCTYCTQRISFARIEAEKQGRKVRDGEVVTACQSVCPTEAIVFGDLNDKESQVSKHKSDKRNFTVLYDLNTQPRTTYLAGLKNQNKNMPDYIAPKKKEKKAQEGGN
jgi:molybdopterin-containing oxidoreductase family iron-sulfur binding subunit